MTSCPALAGASLPETGASTNTAPRSAAMPASLVVHSTPTVPICTQMIPGPAASKPPGPVAACSVAAPSASIVMTIAAPRTASAGLAATTAPSAAKGSAWATVRFHTRTSKPPRARLAAIGPPIRPVPIKATTGVAARSSRPVLTGVPGCAAG